MPYNLTSTSKIIIALVLSLAIYSTFQYFRTGHFIKIGESLAEEAKTRPFEQHPKNPTARILNIGDSSVVGTGSKDEKLSVAGRLGADFPTAEIINLGINGTKTKELIERFQNIQDQRFDLIVIHTGGNDIVRFTPLDELEESLMVTLDLANNITDSVIILHGGNVGTSRLFPIPMRWIYTYRTSKVRDIWKKVSIEKNVHYVDLWRKFKEDPFHVDPDKYYSPDIFHPSGEGYGDWYRHIKEIILKTKFNKNNS